MHTTGRLEPCLAFGLVIGLGVKSQVVPNTEVYEMVCNTLLGDEANDGAARSRANAAELARRWNAFEEGGLVAELKDALKGLFGK